VTSYLMTGETRRKENKSVERTELKDAERKIYCKSGTRIVLVMASTRDSRGGRTSQNIKQKKSFSQGLSGCRKRENHPIGTTAVSLYFL